MLWDNCSAKGAAKEYRAELSPCLFLSFRYLSLNHAIIFVPALLLPTV